MGIWRKVVVLIVIGVKKIWKINKFYFCFIKDKTDVKYPLFKKIKVLIILNRNELKKSFLNYSIYHSYNKANIIELFCSIEKYFYAVKWMYMNGNFNAVNLNI